MMVILDQYPVSGIGTFEIRQIVTVKVSAEETRRQVQRWLLLEVSHMLGADEPILVVGQRTVWRVPAHLSAPQVGVVGQVGVVEVDATTGEKINLAVHKAAIEQRARELIANLPPFRPQTSVPEACIPKHVARAPRLILADDGEPILLPATVD